MNFLSKRVYRIFYFAVHLIETARKMAAIFFLHDDDLAKKVLLFFDNVKYDHLLNVFTNAN